jgi:hypothetical protein
MKRIYTDLMTIILSIIFIIFCLSIIPYIFMVLWNWLIPMFWASAPILNFWHALGIVILIKLIQILLFSNKTN